MEFLLPVALKLFPNMLPSTFKDKMKEQVCWQNTTPNVAMSIGGLLISHCLALQEDDNLPPKFQIRFFPLLLFLLSLHSAPLTLWK